MRPDLDNATSLHSSTSYANLRLDQLVEMVTKISALYTSLEFIKTKDGPKLSDVSKATIRKSQADIQKIRLKLLDLIAAHNKNS